MFINDPISAILDTILKYYTNLGGTYDKFGLICNPQDFD